MEIKTFRAFRSRNYRLYFLGQSTSLIGTWMQNTAVYWVIYTKTHSPFMLGLAVFASQFPSFLLSPLGGVMSDRYNRYRLLLATQSASLIQAALLVSVVVFTQYELWEIYVLSLMLGIINAFDVPTRQAMVNEIIEHSDDLPNAIALNSSMVNLARLVGPAISGIVLEKMGAGTCFFINALSFMAVITCLLFMRLPKYIHKPQTKKVLHEFQEGWKYIKATPAIGLMILLLACVSLFVLPFTTLLPIFAKVIFKGNAATFGYLNSAIGLGAMGGTVFLASLKSSINLKKILFANLLILGIGLILFSHITNLHVAIFFATMAGFGMMSQTTISNTIIQTNSSREMRGRVISFFAMAFFGMLPIGGLLIGTVSQYIGAPNAILAEGIIALVIAFLFFPFLKKDMVKKIDASMSAELKNSPLNTNE